MKKCFLRGIAIAAIAGFVPTLHAQDSTDQSQYPTILSQPVDQCVPVGSPVTFSVTASNVDSYQWYKNNVLMDGQTNSSLTIDSAQISDVSYYSAAVMKGNDAVPTRMANLNVYTTSSSTTTTTKSRFAMTQSMSGTMSAMDSGGSITMYGTPITGNGGNTNSCPGRYSGYVNFTKTTSQGWGWAPTAGASSHTATDNNRSDTRVTFLGYYMDPGCGTNSVSVTNLISPVYRFGIYFPVGTQVPTNTYAITLTGFDP